jgi:hypothetical protein
MAGNANSGRRPSPPVDVTTLEELTITQVIKLLRLLGRPMSRPKIMAEILNGKLRAYVNYNRLSNHKNPATGKPEPTFVILRKDLDAWRRTSLVLLKVTPHSQLSA